MLKLNVHDFNCVCYLNDEKYDWNIWSLSFAKPVYDAFVLASPCILFGNYWVSIHKTGIWIRRGTHAMGFQNYPDCWTCTNCEVGLHCISSGVTISMIPFQYAIKEISKVSFSAQSSGGWLHFLLHVDGTQTLLRRCLPRMATLLTLMIFSIISNKWFMWLRYRVIQKKVFHKSEKKIHEKMKMT